jgi:hypothetical protein
MRRPLATRGAVSKDAALISILRFRGDRLFETVARKRATSSE